MHYNRIVIKSKQGKSLLMKRRLPHHGRCPVSICSILYLIYFLLFGADLRNSAKSIVKEEVKEELRTRTLLLQRVKTENIN